MQYLQHKGNTIQMNWYIVHFAIKKTSWILVKIVAIWKSRWIVNYITLKCLLPWGKNIFLHKGKFFNWQICFFLKSQRFWFNLLSCNAFASWIRPIDDTLHSQRGIHKGHFQYRASNVKNCLDRFDAGGIINN